MVELNPFLQPIGSPITSSNFISGYSFDSYNDRGIITNSFIRDASITNAKIGTAAIGTANIGTLSFNEISGGTATFGGTTNGNGLVEVLNESGGTVVKLNKDGLAVANGSITVKNSSGNSSLDSLGVVSVSNFSESVVSISAGGTQRVTTNNVFEDVVGGSVSFITTRTRVILINLMTQFYIVNSVSGGTTDFSGNGVFEISLNGTQPTGGVISTGGYNYANSDSIGSGGAAGVLTSSSTHYFTTVGAGTNVLKSRVKIDHIIGTPNIIVYGTRLSYILLGT